MHERGPTQHSLPVQCDPSTSSDFGTSENLGRVELAENFDEMAVVVDWLDCCRNRNLQALLDLYAEDALLECVCEDARVSGRAQLAGYWKPKLAAGISTTAFGLEEIIPVADKVMLEYLSFAGAPVRITFTFDAHGKISHTRCEPSQG